jgi:hypothetical protein
MQNVIKNSPLIQSIPRVCISEEVTADSVHIILKIPKHLII